MIRPRYDNADGRMRGAKLQARRLKVWTKHPYCVGCGKLVEYNAVAYQGFHLDHKVALVNGGEDTEDNCQILCVPTCHDRKTAKDLGHKVVVRIGSDGFPVESIAPMYEE